MKNLIIKRLEQVLCYLNPLLPFANCHMVDFFTGDIYNRFIPSEIQNEIISMGAENTTHFILNQNLPDSKCPNLIKYLNETKTNTLECFEELCTSLQDFQLKLIDLGCQNLSGLRLDVFMSSKKSHEVEILSEISAALCEISKTDIVVDIGDGKGYLSSALALHSSLKVLGIDSSITNTQNAAKRLSKFQKYVKHDAKNPPNEFYKQLTKFVTEETDLYQLVQQFFPSASFTLIGLHTCGNLASTCLKIFVQNPHITSICNVGCCYHLLDEEFSGSGLNFAFPLSNFLRERKFHIGRNARMLAAQSLDRIINNKELPSKILFYRALLQLILVKNHPDLLSKHVGKNKKQEPSFLEYVRRSFLKFDTNLSVSEEEVLDLYEKYLPEENILQVFYLIRAHLAPVIESVILLDRLLYLYENDLTNVFLVKFFNPVISPRCYGTVAFKNGM